jgi:hypothetical protein
MESSEMLYILEDREWEEHKFLQGFRRSRAMWQLLKMMSRTDENVN